MAKNYTKSSFAVNKLRKGIVYKSVMGDYEITLEQFLKANTGNTEKDFEYWKNISDEIYKDEDVFFTKTTRLDVSINDIDETLLVSDESVEDIYFRESEEQNHITRADIINFEYILSVAEEILTDTQYQRFFDYFIEGKKLEEIAAYEGVGFSSVSKSISSSVKKIQKYIKNICIKNSVPGIF